MIKAASLTKIYNPKRMPFTALDQIDLEVAEGETVGILGKSGSGKSTLMHILALLDTPTSGALHIGGVATQGMSGVERARLRSNMFGFIFQQFYLQPRLSVYENVAFTLKIQGTSRKMRKQLVMEALEKVGLADKAKNKATDISGGQKQRVAIARAIVNNPRILFADEPTGNLDTQTSDMIEDLLLDLNKQSGITLIVVTHDEDLATRFDRIIRISDGHIISDSTTQQD